MARKGGAVRRARPQDGSATANYGDLSHSMFPPCIFSQVAAATQRNASVVLDAVPVLSHTPTVLVVSCALLGADHLEAPPRPPTPPFEILKNTGYASVPSKK